MTHLRPETVRDLWDHVRGLLAQAEREADHPAVRRALVTCAVAGSGGDADGFRALLDEVYAVARRLAFADPQPLFDAAAALVAEDDVTAREIIVLAPERRGGAGAPGSGGAGAGGVGDTGIGGILTGSDDQDGTPAG